MIEDMLDRIFELILEKKIKGILERMIGKIW